MFKKFATAGALAALMIGGSAMAAPFASFDDFETSNPGNIFGDGPGASSSLNFDIIGKVEKACHVRAFLDGPFDDIDLSAGAVGVTQGAESVAFICNYAGGAMVTYSSLNAGVLENQDDNSFTVDYTMSGTGGSGLAFADEELDTDVVLKFVSPGILDDQGSGLSIKTKEAGTAAGTYSDTITVTIEVN